MLKVEGLNLGASILFLRKKDGKFGQEFANFHEKPWSLDSDIGVSLLIAKAAGQPTRYWMKDEVTKAKSRYESPKKAGRVDQICYQWWSYKMDDAINSANGKKTKWPRHLIQNICDCKNTAVKCLMKKKIKRAPLWGTNIKKIYMFKVSRLQEALQPVWNFYCRLE